MKGQPLIALALVIGSWVVMRINLGSLATQSVAAVHHTEERPMIAAKTKPNAVVSKTLTGGQFSPSGRRLPRYRSLHRLPVPPVAPSSVDGPAPAQIFGINRGATQTPAADSSVAPQTAPVLLKLYAVTSAEKLNITGSFWLLARGSSAATFSNPSLGASQLGGRAVLPLVRLNDHSALAASLRGSAPISGQGKEVAVGLSLKVKGAIPIELIAERRLALSKAQTGEWAFVAASGFDDVRITRKVSISAYGQAGFVGLKRPDLFAGGSITARRDVPISSQAKTAVGIAVWGEAQARAARIDIGPEISASTRAGPLPLRVAVQWRFRAAGRASPTSGPTLVLSGDF